MFYMGIDLHKHYSYIVVIDDIGNVVSKQRLLMSKQFSTNISLPLKNLYLPLLKQLSTGIFSWIG